VRTRRAGEAGTKTAEANRAVAWLRNTDRRYGLVAIFLHWTIAAAILALLIQGPVMVRLTPGSSLQFELYQLHKSLGVSVLALSVVRLAWRLVNRVPPLPATLKPWEATTARVTHRAFYVLMLALPLTGWMMVSASPWNIPTVVFGAFTLPHLPVLDSLANKQAAEGMLKQVHLAGSVAMTGLLLLHVAGALKHHFVLKDDTLVRMLPGRSPAPGSAGDGEAR
jgi:cytochrome b561